MNQSIESEIYSELLNILDNDKVKININPIFDIPIYISKKNRQSCKKRVLILSGGGIKGLAHVGAMKALDELGYLDNIEEFAGASVGSLILGMFLVGYSPNEMKEFISKFNFKKLLKIDIFGILHNFGIDSGKNLEYVIKRLIEAKGYNPNVTLNDLYKKTKKKILFTSVCINNKSVVYISHENFPNLPLFKAIRMSSAIPWFYCPVKYSGKFYIDGACMDNYPIQIYEDRLGEVIGIYLEEGDDCVDTIDNIELYSQRVFKCIGAGINLNSKKSFKEYTINIHLDPILAINYDLDPETKNRIFMKGYSTIMGIFK